MGSIRQGSRGVASAGQGERHPHGHKAEHMILLHGASILSAQTGGVKTLPGLRT